MKNTLSHVHDKTDHLPERYLGENGARAVIEWLNLRPKKKSDDPVEQLIRAYAKWTAGENVNAATKQIRSILRRSKLVLTPYWFPVTLHVMRFSKHRGELAPKPITDWRRWGIEWDATAEGMDRAQSLALRELLELASRGLLGHVKKCERGECGRWFFARFRHQRFDSKKCQLEVFRSSPEWKQKRREYMKRLRHEERQERVRVERPRKDKRRR
ncbi:MAG: hypothetical protein LAO19_02445 [Acidobacteriia bacterium]|nr:hypothetical protein [Terriglobia bacterium]